MYKEIFEGPKVNVIQMLDSRDQRVERQRQLLSSVAGGCLLSLHLNIPGPVKQSQTLQEVFDETTAFLQKQLQSLSRGDFVVDHEVTGSGGFLLLKGEPETVKRFLVSLEEEHPYGRLWDLDLLWFDDNQQLATIGRQDLGLPPRKCLLCQANAKVCGRSRRHSLEELQEAIGQIVQQK